ncbi:hypothetical protein [uncultured Paraglaciecola sp.]|uniref:hypothetical protein n=1 Tax=uncultured Paraglaciecola sp. TaxID=1765024 RepID=UPI002593F788|nr:hypothetical protein [uncultured Paraglaciecola sp.]
MGLNSATWIIEGVKRMDRVHFWNGNKSASRQAYEVALLKACLRITDVNGQATSVYVDNIDYPDAADEGRVFATDADVLVTVAGNSKFDGINKLVVPSPLTKGLLGFRLLIVRDASLPQFAKLTSQELLQQHSIGIPNTWADAALFRHNHYPVIERGSLDELFHRLKLKEFDYVALGVNEIEDIYNHLAAPLGGLSIEPSLMLYYPFPLVFYVNPNRPDLVKRLQKGLQALQDTNEFSTIFNHYHDNLLEKFSLAGRTLFTLENPQLPQSMVNFHASLLD